MMAHGGPMTGCVHTFMGGKLTTANFRTKNLQIRNLGQTNS